MLLTFGHGTASAEQMTGLARGAGVSVLIDVRIAPGSRRHPHVARAALERWLPEAGICYRWDKRLGGFRRVRSVLPPRHALRSQLTPACPAERSQPRYARKPDVCQAVPLGVIANASYPSTVSSQSRAPADPIAKAAVA
jgi:Protein of unknown function, DUF488